MSNLQIEISIAALVLFILIIMNLKKNSLSVKSSIMWLLLPVIFLIIAIFPEPLTTFASWIGFEQFSNFIFMVIIALLIVLCFFLTINTSRQQDQINKLNQELSILKDKKHK